LNVIVGSEGFIGQHYTRCLTNINEDFFRVPTREALLNIISANRALTLGEVSNVIWLAGKTFPFNCTSINNPNYMNDLESLDCFLEFLQGRRWSGRFIFLSSGGCVYASSSNPLSESSKLGPNNLYGTLKLEQEKLVIASGIMHSILRVANVFGHKNRIISGQDVISNWISNYKLGNTCEVYGNLDSFRDYINVIDVVRAIMSCSMNSTVNHLLNIGSGEVMQTRELMELFTRHTHGQIKFHFKNSREIDRNGYVLDISHAKKVLGWIPTNSHISDVSDFIVEELRK
jgi:UDP-glucose 4-epimerase